MPAFDLIDLLQRRNLVLATLCLVFRVVDPERYVDQTALWNRQPVRLFVFAWRLSLEIHVQGTIRVVLHHGRKQSVAVDWIAFIEVLAIGRDGPDAVRCGGQIRFVEMMAAKTRSQ